MKSETLPGQVVAVLSRRSAGLEVLPGEPFGFPARAEEITRRAFGAPEQAPRRRIARRGPGLMLPALVIATLVVVLAVISDWLIGDPSKIPPSRKPAPVPDVTVVRSPDPAPRRSTPTPAKSVTSSPSVTQDQSSPVSIPRGAAGTIEGLDWQALARCESGGFANAVNPAGYYGLFQFSDSAWRRYGGKGHASEATTKEQLRRAHSRFEKEGALEPWPVCGRKLYPTDVQASGIDVVVAASGFAGTPYAWQGTSRSGLSSEGLVRVTLKKVGIDMPADLQKQLSGTVATSSPHQGDLVFMLSGGVPWHVGVYAGNGLVWISPRAGDVVRLKKVTDFSSTTIMFRRVQGLLIIGA